MHLPLPGDTTRSELAGLAILVLSAFTFYLEPSPIVYVPALAVVIVVSWLQLPLALSLVVLFAPFAMLPKHLGRTEFAPSELFLWLDVLLAPAWLWRRGTRGWEIFTRLRSSPFLYPALLFLAAGAASTLVAADRHVAIRYFREWILVPQLFFVLLLLLQSRMKHWWGSFIALIGAGLLLGVIALVQRVTLQDLTQDAGSTLLKVRAVYGSPDNLGLFLDRVIPVWLGSVVLLKGGLRQRLLLSIAGLLLLGTLLLTFSRGAWLATGIACVALLASRPGWGRWAAVASIVVVVLGGIVAGPKIVNALKSGHSNTVQQRIYVWQAAGRMIRAHPLLGIGPDNFVHYYAPKPAPHQYFQQFCAPGLGFIDARAASEPCLSHPHNEFLDFWLSTGLAGLAAFLWMQVAFWRTWVRLHRRISGATAALLAGTGGAMLAALLHGLVDNSYFLMDLGLIFWLLIAFVSWLTTGLDGVSAGTTPTADGARPGPHSPAMPA